MLICYSKFVYYLHFLGVSEDQLLAGIMRVAVIIFCAALFETKIYNFHLTYVNRLILITVQKSNLIQFHHNSISHFSEIMFLGRFLFLTFLSVNLNYFEFLQLVFQILKN